MQKNFKPLILKVLILLSLGLSRTYAQISLTIDDARKINETYARLALSEAENRLCLIDLKSYKDSTTIYKDSATYWKNQAFKLKRRRNNWRTLAIGEAIFIALTSRKKQ